MDGRVGGAGQGRRVLEPGCGEGGEGEIGGGGRNLTATPRRDAHP